MPQNKFKLCLSGQKLFEEQFSFDKFDKQVSICAMSVSQMNHVAQMSALCNLLTYF